MKELQSDKGGEYTEHNFEFRLKKNGILHRLYVPYTPQQNGMAERLNQTILNVTRCLIIHSGLPQSSWAKALQTASYIRNLYPSSAIRDSIPFELWNKQKLREHRHRTPEVFSGCMVWASISTNKEGKLGPCAVECVMLGYPEGVKGYRLWNIKERKVIVAQM
jgi:hypothetical protein